LKPSLRRGFLRLRVFIAVIQWASGPDPGEGKVLISGVGVIVEISTKRCAEQAGVDSTKVHLRHHLEQQTGSPYASWRYMAEMNECGSLRPTK